jgi:hypothetical protein
LENEIVTLIDEYKLAGRNEVELSIYSGEGWNLSSGVYFYQLKVVNYVSTKKMIYLK